MTMVPWVEKYRPQLLENIVLSDDNKTIFQTMLDESRFPNLLFYGPPGTGKTTSILSLIHMYQVRHKETNQGLVLHLNASDDRGIDVIRSQIYTFVTSKHVLGKGTKFVILDEVDCMTKTAQQALRYLLHYPSVRFCLIANYVSKIEESLESEVMTIRFDHLPKEHILALLERIALKESLEIPKERFVEIQLFYGSDIRSMINYMQSNPTVKKITGPILWNELTQYIHEKENVNTIMMHLHTMSQDYSIDTNTLLKEWITYALLHNHFNVNPKDIKYAMHALEVSSHATTLLILTLLS